MSTPPLKVCSLLDEIAFLLDSTVDLDHPYDRDTLLMRLETAFEVRLATAKAEGEREGMERAAARCSEVRDRVLAARDKAAAAGREGVASHRQSDAETLQSIEYDIRALAASLGTLKEPPLSPREQQAKHGAYWPPEIPMTEAEKRIIDGGASPQSETPPVMKSFKGVVDSFKAVEDALWDKAEVRAAEQKVLAAVEVWRDARKVGMTDSSKALVAAVDELRAARKR
jgi:hypothetical protein